MSGIRLAYPACLAALLLASPVHAEKNESENDGPANLQILGWVEHAYLIEPEFEMMAKLDTGALTSSLDARIIKRFRQFGKRWVRFAVRDRETGKEVTLVRERQRTIGIVQHEGDSEVRPTVLMEVCIAGIEREIEVSLVDRENFTYPLLLGRRTLKHIAVVHPGATFLSDSHCLEPHEDDPESEPTPTTEESPEEESEPSDGAPDETIDMSMAS